MPNKPKVSEISRNYKSWFINYLHRSDSFFDKYLLVSVEMVKNLKRLSFCQGSPVSQCPWNQKKQEKLMEIILYVNNNGIFENTELASTLDQERLLCAVNTKVLLSGEAEGSPHR